MTQMFRQSTPRPYPLSRSGFLTWLLGFCLLGFCLLSFLAASAHAGQDPVADFRPATLDYRASKLFISAQTQIQQQVISAEQARQQLLSPPEGTALEPAGGNVIKQRLVTEVLGLRSEIDVWLNPDASILQRTSLSSGRKHRYRAYRYTPHGAYSLRLQPANDREAKTHHNNWSRRKETFFDLGQNRGQSAFSEPEALFYLIAVARLSQPGDSLTLPVFDNDRIVLIKVSVIAEEPLRVDFDEIKDGASRRISGTIPTLKARLVATAADPGADGEEFSFLGYKGDVDLYIDPQRRVIVQLSGAYDFLGQVDIRLQRLDYRS